MTSDKITAAGKKGIFGKLRQSGASFSKLMTGGGATASSKIIAEGTPEKVSTEKSSFTGQFLKDIIGSSGMKKTA